MEIHGRFGFSRRLWTHYEVRRGKHRVLPWAIAWISWKFAYGNSISSHVIVIYKPLENEWWLAVAWSNVPGIASRLDIDIRLFIRLDWSWHEPRWSSASNFGAYGSQLRIFPQRCTNNPMAHIHRMSTKITMKASSGRTTILCPVWKWFLNIRRHSFEVDYILG